MIYLAYVGTKQRIEQNTMGPNPIHLLSLRTVLVAAISPKMWCCFWLTILAKQWRGVSCCPLVKDTLPEFTPICPGYTCIGAKQVPMAGPKPTFKKPAAGSERLLTWPVKMQDAVGLLLPVAQSLHCAGGYGCSWNMMWGRKTWSGSEGFNTLNSSCARRQIQRETPVRYWTDSSLEAETLL